MEARSIVLKLTPNGGIVRQDGEAGASSHATSAGTTSYRIPVVMPAMAGRSDGRRRRSGDGDGNSNSRSVAGRTRSPPTSSRAHRSRHSNRSNRSNHSNHSNHPGHAGRSTRSDHPGRSTRSRSSPPRSRSRSHARHVPASRSSGRSRSAAAMEARLPPHQDPKATHPRDTRRHLKERTRRARAQERDDGSFLGNGDARPGLSFGKALPRGDDGTVSPAAHEALAKAILDRTPEAWSRVPLGGDTRLVDPLGAMTWDYAGAPGSAIGIPPPPRVRSSEMAADMAELYRMCMCRDVRFESFRNDERATAAASDLAQLVGYRGPRDPAHLFRGPTEADHRGPYLSQLLLQPFQAFGGTVAQRYGTPPAGVDYMTTREQAVAAQAGRPSETNRPLGEPSHIRTGRQLAWLVRSDAPADLGVQAAKVLLSIGAPWAPGNPYRGGGDAPCANQHGGIDFGDADVLDAVSRVSRSALASAAYCKWMVTQRLRPEEMGLLIDNTFRTLSNPLHISSQILFNNVLNAVMGRTGSRLLPQAYAEGAPAHPSCPSAHAAIAAATATVLKAFFDEQAPFPRPVAVASDDGLALAPLPVGAEPLTVGGELDKYASNVGLARAWAGVNYRSDCAIGWALGEQVAVRMLEDLVERYPHDGVGFSFHLRDGTPVSVRKKGR
jgi:hypothetical protein